MTARDAATERQVRAARPDASTWLAANAGSGKTRVLTDRVARLLFAGADPRRILCLTYTKAAASEMQNRLFDRLGAWAMLDDAELARALDRLGAGDDLSPDRLADARTLFARAIETPGGLKIQTIHAFCATLLRRFPLEARVSPQFTEMEDRAAARLRAEILSDMAEGPEAGLIDAIARHLSDEGIATFTATVTSARDRLTPAPTPDDVARALGLPPGLGEGTILSTVFAPGTLDLIARVIAALEAGSKTDQKAADKLRTASAPSMESLRALENVLLTGSGAKMPFSAKIGSFPTKGTRNGLLAADMAALEALMQRVEDARAHRCALAAADKSAALHGFAQVFLAEYARRKQARGWLDFDDLILNARQLLTDPAVAAWVLYRLDGGIDHILVDEAQDTSPGQWDVIEKLAQEFTSGAGARADVARTIFVVGDKKQSIYSFQGADPGAFDRMQTEFAERLDASGAALRTETLAHSFRSSPAILGLVDAVFRDDANAGFDPDASHIAFRPNLPGRVDLWPPVPPPGKADDQPWHDPVDRVSDQHEAVALAHEIAKDIAAMIDEGEKIPVAGPDGVTHRPVTAGDILILVRRRSAIFAEIIRACKEARLPIAGADRLKVGAELAVRDLGALLSFLATPEDSLSLAAALKSPLFGLDEAALFDLAHGRNSLHLWPAMRARRAEYPDALAIIDDLMDQADYLRPYDLIERILTRHDGRRNLLARLGAEAEDGIDSLLSQALAYEATDIPSLTGFLQWMETDDLEIKRQLGTAQGQIRVMTVHGAKGLEAPVVILPDTGTWRTRTGGALIDVEGLPLWRVSADDQPPAMAAAAAEARARDEAERLRLLYVALTRAESWLIVAAAGDLGSKGGTWHDRVRMAMESAGAAPLPTPTGEGLRLAHGDWDGPARPTPGTAPAPAHDLPGFATTHAPAPPARARAVSPSDLGGAKALPGDAGLDEEAAKRRGTQVHLLLERLPDIAPPGWPEAAEAMLPDLSAEARDDLLAEATTVLTRPELAFLFAGDTLAEVPVSAEIDGIRYHGVIDRLVVSEARILAVDFKSNATVPARAEDVPEGIQRQMGAYDAALRQVFPGRPVDTAILWTRTAGLMPLPHDTVTEAFARRLALDGNDPPT